MTTLIIIYFVHCLLSGILMALVYKWGYRKGQKSERQKLCNEARKQKQIDSITESGYREFEFTYPDEKTKTNDNTRD